MAVHLDTHPKHAHPALFGLLVMPFGLIVGFSDNALSYLLGEHGWSTVVIGGVVALVGLPHAWKFLWAPALDLGTKRKTWFLASVVVGALGLAVAALLPLDENARVGAFSSLEILTAVVLVAEAAAATSTAAVDALMAITLPNDKKGAAAGWSMAGNVGGTGIGGAAITWLMVHVHHPLLRGGSIAALILACGLPAFIIRERQPVRHPALPAMRHLVTDVWATIRSREGWTGLAICLTPVGTGSLMKLFGKVSQEYIADPVVREHTVELVNGLMGGFVGALGSLLCGYLADRMNRRLLYILGGLATAFSAVGMALAPATATSFTVGCLSYSFFNGVCYAAFAAFVLEMIGHGPGVTTKYALFVGTSNFAISYVAALDGFGEGWGVSLLGAANPSAKRIGVIGTDALLTFLGVCFLVVIFVYLRKRPIVAMQVTPVNAISESSSTPGA